MKYTLNLLLCLWLIIGGNASGQVKSSSIRNLHINCFHQDHLGFLWIGTAKGLYKYDGYEYEYYVGNPADSTNVLGDAFYSICSDSNNTLWFSTERGIIKYDYKKDEFSGIAPRKYCLGLYNLNDRIYATPPQGICRIDEAKCKAELCPILKEATVHSLIEWNGKIWAGCQVDRNYFIYVFDHSFSTCLERHEVKMLPKVLYGTHDNLLLIGTEKGIITLSGDSLRQEVPFTAEVCEILNQLDITLIQKYGDSSLLIGSANKGLYVFNEENRRILPIEKFINGANVPSRHITSCLLDNARNLWVGSFDKGFFLVKKDLFYFNQDRALHNAFSGNFVTDIMEAGNELWVGTRILGLGRYNRHTKQVTYYNKTNSPLFDLANTNFVQVIFLDSKQRLWVGTDSHLSLCSFAGGRLHVLRTYNVRAVCIAEDAQGGFWIGTGREGLVKLATVDATPQYIKHKHVVNVPKIISLDNRHILISSYGFGIYTLDIETESIHQLELPDTGKDLAGRVIELYQGHNGVLWLGTYGYGLGRYDLNTKAYTHYSYNEGLSSNDVLAIEEDGEGDLWFSTSWGLSRMDKESGAITNFFDNNGVIGNQYHEKCSLKDSRGNLYFSGNHGLTFFHPSDIIMERGEHPVHITGLKILNEEVKAGDRHKVLQENIAYVRTISLTHQQNTFSIDYAAIQFGALQKINYAYKLDGFDKTWNYVGNHRKAAYSNVPAGTYTFMVRAQNNDGTWSDANISTLEVKVSGSPWLSPWAIAVYLLVCFSVAFMLIRMYIRNKLYDKRLSLLEREKQHEREVMQVKMNFLGNISHEIRTPLTLIYGCVNLLQMNVDTDEKVKLTNLINYNMQRLLRLLSQMMEYGKIEKETLPLKVEPVDVAALVESLIHSYEYYVKEKNITLTFTSNLQDGEIMADADKLDKILNNLLSNAVKYTPDNGSITLEITEKDLPLKKFGVSDDTQYVMFSVKDTGVGVSAIDLPHLFDRFSRFKGTDNSNKTSIDGFGIGLHYVKKLIEAHKGGIVAMPNSPTGMVFSFVIPVAADFYGETDRKSMNEIILTPGIAEQDAAGDNRNNDEESLSILIVDDNTEILFYISKILSDRKFNIITATNGVEGLEKAKKIIPDIILSDVLMPRMDGYEFCRQIKNDTNLCHIPVILLTAKVSKEDYISGYSTGASIFVEKPFYPEVLLAQIDNILKFRTVLQQEIQSLTNTEELENKQDEGLKLNSLDKKFLESLYNYIERELDNESLSVDKIGKDLGFSRTSFYRKMIKLVGQTPNDFIRTYRLKKAKELIATGEYTLSEIASITGFGTYSNFSVRFKKMYGVSPREYKHEQ